MPLPKPQLARSRAGRQHPGRAPGQSVRPQSRLCTRPQLPAGSRHAASLLCPRLRDQASISQPARNTALRPREVLQLVILLRGARHSFVISLGKLPSSQGNCWLNPGSDGDQAPPPWPSSAAPSPSLPHCSEDGSDPTYCKTATSSVSPHVICFTAPKGCSKQRIRASGGG